MKKAILIDGNNLLFRSYYATAYTGNMMKNSSGLPTNAIYGFISMINKILKEESPEYIMVAFDKGKNFRHELYKEYKDGRIETPKELLVQFPIAKEVLTHMGIKYLEIDNYEADDIIGTFARMADEDRQYDATIISSDRDLLQLISPDVDVKLLKQKDYIYYNETTFFRDFGIKPINIIDLKALEGDKSDNIPGVKGVGEKTALTLIQKYTTIENMYNHIEEISGKLKEKLVNDKENAIFSKRLATIYKDIDFNMTFEDLKIGKVNEVELNKMYEELEFYSLLKNRTSKEEDKVKISDLKSLEINDTFAFYLEMDAVNYHTASIIGASVYDGKNSYYLTEEEIVLNKDIFKNKIISYDVKKVIVALKKLGIDVDYEFDTMISGYILEENVRDDIAYLANTSGYNIPFYESIINKKKPMEESDIKNAICLKAKYLYETKESYIEKLKKATPNGELFNLYNTIELPLIRVLAKMEINGVYVNRETLNEIKEEIEVKLEKISNEIYNMAGLEFNISSPKQLGEVLFERLSLPHKGEKKGRNGYSTSHDVLVKLVGVHPIIESILEYRNLNKIFTTYLDSLGAYILEDGKIHTIYKQTIARTGRLSSIEPNLQNIPIRNDEGRKIRKAFVPSPNSVILSSDYSQIELRVLADISGCENLIAAFRKREDIHTTVASDIFGVEPQAVTKKMRRTAKAVIFGIVYGISGYGLGDNLDIPVSEAKKFIDKYLTIYPGVKKYMEHIVTSAKEHGCVMTLFGRKRTIEELKNPNYMIRASGERIALNTPIQGTSADIIKKAMIEVDKLFTENNIKSKLILQVHDELIVDALKSEEEIVKKLVEEAMENAYTLAVPLKVEIETGNNWYDA